MDLRMHKSLEGYQLKMRLPVLACNGSTNVEDTLIYFVSKFIVDYAFLLYYGLLNGPRNSRTENARWQTHIAISVVDLNS